MVFDEGALPMRDGRGGGVRYLRSNQRVSCRAGLTVDSLASACVTRRRRRTARRLQDMMDLGGAPATCSAAVTAAEASALRGHAHEPPRRHPCCCHWPCVFVRLADAAYSGTTRDVQVARFAVDVPRGPRYVCDSGFVQVCAWLADASAR